MLIGDELGLYGISEEVEGVDLICAFDEAVVQTGFETKRIFQWSASFKIEISLPLHCLNTEGVVDDGIGVVDGETVAFVQDVVRYFVLLNLIEVGQVRLQHSHILSNGLGVYVVLRGHAWRHPYVNLSFELLAFEYRRRERVTNGRRLTTKGNQIVEFVVETYLDLRISGIGVEDQLNCFVNQLFSVFTDVQVIDFILLGVNVIEIGSADVNKSVSFIDLGDSESNGNSFLYFDIGFDPASRRNLCAGEVECSSSRKYR